MLDINLIFKIAGISLLIIVLDKILETTGKEEYAMVVNLAGIIIILMMVLQLVSKLFDEVRTMFSL